MLQAIKKHMKIVKTCNLYLSFFMVGMSLSLTGPCLLDLEHMVNTDTQHIALIYTVRSIGYLLGAICGGVILDIVSYKQFVLMVCNLVTSITMFGIPWSMNFEILVAFMVVNGMALGAIETGANVLCLQIWGKESGPFFQAMHFTFGVGGLISPLIAAPFLSKQNELPFYTENNTTFSEEQWLWNSTDMISSSENATSTDDDSRIVYPFSVIGIVALLITFLFVVVCVISPTEEEVDSQEDKVVNSERSFCFMSSTILLTFLLIFMIAGTEIGFGQTLTTYAVKGRLHVTKVVGSYMTSAYWASFTFFRLVGVFLAMKVNNLYLLIGDTFLVGVSALILMFLMPNEWALWLAAVVFGAGIASGYASIIGWVNTQIHVTNKIAAVIAVGCAAGEMVMPFIIAYFLEVLPEIFDYVIAACCILTTTFLFALHCVFKSGNQKQAAKDKKVECYVVSVDKKERECCELSNVVT